MSLGGDLADLLSGPESAGDGWTWATVTATSPLRVRRDGEAAALDLTPDVLAHVGTLSVGHRVWCQIRARRVIVHGKG